MWGLIHPAARVELLRFNAGSLVLLLVCTGAILAGDQLRESGGLPVMLTLALGSAVIAIVSLNGIVNVWPTLVSTQRRTEIRQANVPSWQAVDFANAKLDPATDKILMIGEARALWLKIPFLAPSAFNGRQLADLFARDAGPDGWTQCRCRRRWWPRRGQPVP